MTTTAKKPVEITEQLIIDGGDSQTLTEIYKVRLVDLGLEKISNLTLIP